MKEGVYFKGLIDSTYKHTVPVGHIVKNKKVYEKPNVVLFFQDQIETIRRFDTYKEAKEYAFELTNNRKWLLN